MNLRFAAAAGGGVPPAHDLTRSVGPGRLVIHVPGVPKFTPDSPADRVFMDEYEHYDAPTRAVIRATLHSKGCRSVALGPAFALPYTIGGRAVTPATDWRTEADHVVACFQELTNEGFDITLVIGPDCAPFFNGDAGWDFSQMGTLVNVYQRLFPYVQKVRMAWELATLWENFVKLIAWIRSIGWQGRISFHNPDGHLGPGDSSQDEGVCANQCVAAGLTDWDYQGPLYNDTSTERTPGVEQAVWDVEDLRARLDGGRHEWAGPIRLRPELIAAGFGDTPRVNFSEAGDTESDFHGEDVPDSLYTNYARRMIAAGCATSEDGIP